MWNKPRLLNAIADLLTLSAAAAALVAALVWLVRVPSLPVRQVVFAQELQHTRRAEIEQSLPGALKGNFFSLNLETVRGELEKLPWVRKVELRRTWPARLEVKVEEHRPAARWGEGRGELVNTFGEVFAATAPDEELDTLPLLYGPQGTAPEVLKRYGEFVGNFKVLGQKPVQVTLSPRLAWQLKLDNGMLVEMGREQQKSPVGVRLQRFIEAYPELVAKRAARPAVVDLRYPNGFAMRVAGDVKGK
ncbi:MAG: cell division protein FtsQ/DivIB [Azonexus sp.]|jgi:cell division protein FtsQ